jgi:zinc protease
MAELRAAGPTQDEVATARTLYEVSFHGSLSTIQGKADRLNGWALTLNEPDGAAIDLARYDAVTIDTVRAAANTWLPADRRLVLRIQPEPVAAAPAAPAAGGK